MCARRGVDMRDVLIQQVKMDHCDECGDGFLDRCELESRTLCQFKGFVKRLFK